jgi:hypothetical protein
LAAAKSLKGYALIKKSIGKRIKAVAEYRFDGMQPDDCDCREFF